MSSKRVLIVDHDRDLVRVLRVRCESLGLEARTAYDGMEAAYELMVIHDNPPDLIILDVNLPLENGLTICEMLCEDPLLAAVPVIVLTGSRDEETVRRCEELGVHYLAKGPDTWDRLKPVVVGLLGLERCLRPEQDTGAHRHQAHFEGGWRRNRTAALRPPSG